MFLVAFEITGLVNAQSTGQWTAPSTGPTGGSPAAPLDASSVPQLKSGGTLGINASSGGVGLSDSLSNFGSLIFGNVSGNAISALAGIRFNGTNLQYSNDGGSTWKNIGGLGDTLPVVINSPSSGANGLVMENSGTNGHNTPFITWTDDSSAQKFSIRSDNGNIYMGTGDASGFNGYFSMDIKGNVIISNATGNQYSPKSGYWLTSSCDTYMDPSCSTGSYQDLSCDVNPNDTDGSDCSYTAYNTDNGGANLLNVSVTNPNTDGNIAYDAYYVQYDMCQINRSDPNCQYGPDYQSFTAFNFFTYGTKNVVTTSATPNTSKLTVASVTANSFSDNTGPVPPSGTWCGLHDGQQLVWNCQGHNPNDAYNSCPAGYTRFNFGKKYFGNDWHTCVKN